MPLKGVFGRGVSKELSGDAVAACSWGVDAVLESCVAAKTVFLYRDGKTIFRQGILGDENAVNDGAATFVEAMASKDATYIPALQDVPARAQLRYLPRNAQGAVIAPFGSGRTAGAMIVAVDRKRALSPRDIAWIKAVAGRVGARLR